MINNNLSNYIRKKKKIPELQKIRAFSSDKDEFLRDNIITLQDSIQKISKKIEEDKIKLNIIEERHIKRKSEYFKLSGKPTIKTKEQKMNDMKEKLEKIKNRNIFDPNYGKKEVLPLPGEERLELQKKTNKGTVELNNLLDAINKQKDLNVSLTHEIEEIRKEKARVSEKIEKIKEENKTIERKLDYSEMKNNRIYKDIKFKELIKEKERGKSIESEFLEKRDYLEDRYHKVIEENIRREREHKNDLKKLRLKNAVFGDKARLKSMSKSSVLNSIKLEEDDQIHDRIPILNRLIDKWLYMIKFKKNLIEKYIKHAKELRFSFDKLLLFLGIKELSKLPTIYEKNEQQTNQMDLYLTSLSSEVDNLEEKKNMLEKQIVILKQTKEKEQKEKTDLIEERKAKIQSLKEYNEKLISKINRRRKILENLEQPTFDFLRKMQKTYLTDFIVNKNVIDDNSRINENNIINYLGTVYCYCQLIKDFDESNRENQGKNDSMINDINKSIDFLKKDIKIKLSQINLNTNVKGTINTSIKNVVKHGIDFDMSIKRLANLIVDQVNNSGDFTINNTSNISNINSNN